MHTILMGSFLANLAMLVSKLVDARGRLL
eukprot:SAG31_NODE_20772_length_565_cov_1.446352_1_plen_28_part_01